jgi:hypothetical protein
MPSPSVSTSGSDFGERLKIFLNLLQKLSLGSLGCFSFGGASVPLTILDIRVHPEIKMTAKRDIKPRLFMEYFRNATQ